MKKLVAAALVAATVSTPAFAQDDTGKTPFSGLFAGGVLGYDNARIHTPQTGPSVTNDGLLYGGTVGYDVNLNGAIVGIEGEYTDSNTKNFSRNIAVAGDSNTLRYDRDLYAGVRLGGQVSQNLALYAKGGYTNARVKSFYNNGGAVVESGRNVDGYRLGAGVETTYRGLTGRVEYRYSNYNKVNQAISNTELERHQVAAVLGYRF